MSEYLDCFFPMKLIKQRADDCSALGQYWYGTGKQLTRLWLVAASENHTEEQSKHYKTHGSLESLLPLLEASFS